MATDKPLVLPSQKFLSVFFSVLWDCEGDFKELLNTVEIQDGSRRCTCHFMFARRRERVEKK